MSNCTAPQESFISHSGYASNISFSVQQVYALVGHAMLFPALRLRQDTTLRSPFHAPAAFTLHVWQEQDRRWYDVHLERVAFMLHEGCSGALAHYTVAVSHETSNQALILDDDHLQRDSPWDALPSLLIAAQYRVISAFPA